MCGRYYRRSDKQRIAEAFKVGKLPPGFELPPDYNIAPSTYQPIIRPDHETGEREMVMMRWGLVPAKVADPDSFKIFSTTNARAESILEKPIWRGPFQHTRCLVPIDGLYEWPKPGHAISDTYSEEETGAPADCTEPLAVSGDLFGSRRNRRGKQKRPAHQARLQHHSDRARPVRLRRHLGRMEAAGWNIP